jgi:hypothetical protein
VLRCANHGVSLELPSPLSVLGCLHTNCRLTDREVAKGRSAGQEWRGDPSGGGNAAGRDSDVSHTIANFEFEQILAYRRRWNNTCLFGINGNTYMTHGKITPCGIGPTNQRDLGFVKGLLLQRRSDCGLKTALSDFQKASLPIHPGGGEDHSQVAGSRSEGGLYRQASLELDCAFAATGQCHGSLSECSGHAGFGSLSEKKGAWLSGVVRDGFSCRTALIGYPAASYRRSIGFWFQRRFGLRGRRQDPSLVRE